MGTRARRPRARASRNSWARRRGRASRPGIGSSDRALAGELVAVGRTNTATTAAPWGDGPAYMVVRGTEAQPGLLDQVEEHFETPKTAAGAVNALLTELQLKQLEGLE